MDQLSVQVVAADLVDRDLVHFCQVFGEFGVDPVVEFNDIEVHVIGVLELAAG